MRLRPSGRKGPVATALEAFRSYQETEAWTWEHLALTRARVLAGEPELGAEVEAFRRDLLPRKGRGAAVRADVAAMRERVQLAKPAEGDWEARNGPGRMLDVELCAQMVALLTGSPARDVEQQIAAGAGTILSEADATALSEAYKVVWRLQAGARLLTDKALDLATLGDGGRAFLLRETGVADAASLAARLEAGTAMAAVIVARLTGDKDGEKRDGNG